MLLYPMIRTGRKRTHPVMLSLWALQELNVAAGLAYRGQHTTYHPPKATTLPAAGEFSGGVFLTHRLLPLRALTHFSCL